MIDVSVIMPIHNAGDYLYRSIKSIQDQSIQNFEIIALDDGSTDNSLQILQELQAEDDRIQIISREDKGYAITMNEGLSNANGQYILNIDPDDWIEPDMFERMLSEFTWDTDFVKCGFWFELPEGEQQEYLYSDEAVEFCPRELPPDLKCRFFSSQVAIWTCMIRRSFIQNHHIKLHETEGAAYQDAAFIFQINACANKVRVIPDKLYHYNKTNENASTASSRYPFAQSVEYNWMAKWCRENPYFGMHVRSVLCKARFGSYMWNMARIEPADRLEFAKLVQNDFQDDWNWIDVRMFSKQEFDIFLIAKNSPEEFAKLYYRITKRRANADKGSETN